MEELEYLRKENAELVKKIDRLTNENYKYKRILEEIHDIAHKTRTFGSAENIFLGLTDIINLTEIH